MTPEDEEQRHWCECRYWYAMWLDQPQSAANAFLRKWLKTIEQRRGKEAAIAIKKGLRHLYQEKIPRETIPVANIILQQELF